MSTNGRIKAIEKRLGLAPRLGGEKYKRQVHSFSQLVLAASRLRERPADHHVAEPPKLTLQPGEKSPAQLVLESGDPSKWDADHRRMVEDLERQRLESLR